MNTEKRAKIYEEKKQRIFNAARELFYNLGFAETTMQEIARCANLGKGTLYGYFASKEDLFRELLHFDDARYHAHLTEILREDVNIRAKIIHLGDFNLAMLERQYRLLDDMRRYSIFPAAWKSPDCRKKEEIKSLLEKAVLQGMEEGEIDASLPVGAVAAALFGTLSFYCFWQVIFEKETPGAGEFDALNDIIFGGLAPRETPGKVIQE
ncbi:MAG: TetR/AcrR family transcriptional regulator [Gracilibacteraceae bacterium]|jgi:AcrR family transcriptional regulator|nr:TetR/AcrR family transcriptional regulator [Gracilibacteraceae bacterium]